MYFYTANFNEAVMIAIAVKGKLLSQNERDGMDTK